MMIILPDHVSDAIDARVDEFIAAHNPRDSRDEIRKAMIDAWATYGFIPEIKYKSAPADGGKNE